MTAVTDFFTAMKDSDEIQAYTQELIKGLLTCPEDRLCLLGDEEVRPIFKTIGENFIFTEGEAKKACNLVSEEDCTSIQWTTCKDVFDNAVVLHFKNVNDLDDIIEVLEEHANEIAEKSGITGVDTEDMDFEIKDFVGTFNSVVGGMNVTQVCELVEKVLSNP